MVNRAGFLISRFQVGVGGKTPYQRLKGKLYKRPLARFGECVHYMFNKLAAKWTDGIFLGVHDSSGSYWVGVGTGVFKARSIQLKPAAQKYDAELLKSVAGTPLLIVPGIGFTAMEPLPAIVQPQLLASEPRVDLRVDGVQLPRQVYIHKADLLKHGYTKDCIRCNAAIAGKPSIALHSAACRKRMETALAADPEANERFEAAGATRIARIAKMVERDAKAAKPTVAVEAKPTAMTD